MVGNYDYCSQLGTRQCFSIATMAKRQRNVASETRKNLKNIKASVSK